MKKVRTVLLYTLMLFIILNSKTVFFGILNSVLSKGVLILVTLSIYFMQCASKKRIIISRKSAFAFGLMVLILFGGDIWHRTGIKNVETFLIVLFTSMLISNIVNKEEFLTSYINVIFSIAVISLLCSAVKIISPSFPYMLVQRVKYNEAWYMASPYYTWGWYFLSPRNFGPFWEPGAFQGFLNVGILFLLHTDIKRRRIKLIVLALTVLTTFSTAGYIVLALIIFAFFEKFGGILFYNESESGLHNMKSKKWIMLLLAFVFVVGFVTSSTVIEKFEAGNLSTRVRTNDTIQSLYLCFNNIFFGLGHTINMQQEMIERDITSNSNGLLAMTYTYGFLFTICYVYYFAKGIKNLLGNHRSLQKTCIIIIFAVLFSTENIYWLSFYCVLLFTGFMRQTIKNLDRKNK